MTTSPETVEKPQVKPGGLGVAALVLGILAVVFSIIPIVNILGIIVGIVGLILGLVGVFRSHRVMSIVGAALCLLGIILSVSINNAAVSSINQDLNQQVNQDQGVTGGGPSQDGKDVYEYKAGGQGQANVSYAQVNGSGVSSSGEVVTLPWTKKTSVEAGQFFAPTFTVTTTGGGKVTCDIVKNGKPVAHQEGSGQFGSATCSG